MVDIKKKPHNSHTGEKRKSYVDYLSEILDVGKREMDWPFPPAEVPLSLKNERGPNSFVGAIEGLAYCDYLFAQQTKRDRFIRATLFELMDGKDHSQRNPMFHSTKAHINRALSTRITFAFQLKLMFVEKLQKADNDNERQFILQDLKAVKEELEYTKYIVITYYQKFMNNTLDRQVLWLDVDNLMRSIEQNERKWNTSFTEHVDDDDDTVSTSRSDSSTYIE